MDGEDDILFGAAQFTEGDIIPLTNGNPDGDVASEAGDETGLASTSQGASTTALKELVASGKLVRRKVHNVGDLKQTMDEVMGVGEAEEVEKAIEKARRDMNDAALIKALESKVQLVVSMLFRLYHSSAEHTLYRFQRGYHQALRCCAAYASIPIASRPSLRAAGIRVVANVGCAV